MKLPGIRAALDGVIVVAGKRPVEDRGFAGGPADLHTADRFESAKPEMRRWRIERVKSAAGLDLPHLMPFPVFSVMDDDAAADAVTVSPVVPQPEGDAVSLGFVIEVNLERTVKRVADDVQVAVVLDVDISVGGTVIEVLQAERLFLRAECWTSTACGFLPPARSPFCSRPRCRRRTEAISR